VVLDEGFIAESTADLPELPDARRQRFHTELGLSDYDANLLTASRELADYFEGVARACGDAKLAANWVNGELSAALNKAGLEIGSSPVRAEHLAGLLKRIQDNTLSGKIAKKVFEAMWTGGEDADAVIAAQGLKQITDSGAIEAMVDEILAANAAQVAQYRGATRSFWPFSSARP
jgi:aspartyl-tRNA(Asn)/glutamyl-tRNA(Gln) amidotransferase subunit B